MLLRTLLEKTRNINKLLQRSAEYPVDFDEIALVLSKEINTNVYIVGRYGKIYGNAFYKGFACLTIEDVVFNKGKFPENYNNELLKINETRANFCEINNRCVFNNINGQCTSENKFITIVPIIGGGQRFGTLFLTKLDKEFTSGDLILAEYGATVIGMEILRTQAERLEEKARKRAAVHVVLNTLSYSELEAAEHVFKELDADEGILIASKVADKEGITRSVIVNALRKFESASVIESKSLGMKGTYIRILNDNLLDELLKKNHKQL